jgi:hypothetical protein
MKVGFYTTSPGLCQDSVIFAYQSPMRPDETNRKYGDLYRSCTESGIRLKCIQSQADIEWADVLLVADIDQKRDRLSIAILECEKPKILALEECEVIRPDLWSRDLWSRFDRVLTWRDSLVDNTKIFKANFSEIRQPTSSPPFGQRKFATMICANKTVNHPLELYSARREVVRWYETNEPSAFDLYGFGWDQRAFPLHGSPLSVLNARKLTWCRTVGRRAPSVWRGAVESKQDVYINYKFAYAFENAKNIDGYILEKIFDPMYAGCVPVYWGASNIENHVPPECFVDFRKFSTVAEAHKYLSQIDENSFSTYRKAALRFLSSNESKKFDTADFCEVTIRLFRQLKKPVDQL